MRIGMRIGPFWVSFGGRHRSRARRQPSAAERRDQREKEKAREFMASRRLAEMTPEEYGRHIGLPEGDIWQITQKGDKP